MEVYDEILTRMIEKYEQLCGHEITEQSDIMIRLKVLAGEIYNNTVAANFIKRQMFVSTASGEYLDKHATERGLSRKEASKAVGEVTFSLLQVSDSDVVIEKGTVVSTSQSDAKRFVTDKDVTIKAGKLSADVTVTAAEGGADYNVLKNTVTVMVTPPLYVSKVTNSKAFKGGVNAETDEELRDRILFSYQEISNSTNAVYYKRLAESVNGVYSASVISKARGAGTVDVHVRGKKDSPVNKEVIEQVQMLLDENREFNVDVLVLYAAELKVSFYLNLEVIDGYDFDVVSENVRHNIDKYIDSLNVGEAALLCDLGDIIYHTDGVKNYTFLDAFCSDVYPSKDKYCVVENIDIRQVS